MIRKKRTFLTLAAVLCAASAAQAGTISYQNTVLADNPLVYYQFDELSGTTATNFGPDSWSPPPRQLNLALT